MLRISDRKSRSKRFVCYLFCNTWSQLQQAIALTEMCLMDIAGNYDSFLFIAEYCMRLMLSCIAFKYAH
jgi:hypothetical protein